MDLVNFLPQSRKPVLWRQKSKAPSIDSAPACPGDEAHPGLMTDWLQLTFRCCIALCVDGAYLAVHPKHSLCCAKIGQQIVYGTGC